MNSIIIATPEELEKAFSIRKNVFVEEQGVPLADEFDEFDRLDGKCEHILAYYEGQPVGTGRIRTVEGIGKLERICIVEPYRKFGIGRHIIAALENIALEKGLPKVKLHGQTHAKGFYEKLGYGVSSAEFMEDGIPHVLMTKSME
ncbi:GNAT family N-acetyltransferase [Paenibacillus sp. BK720]|uniref:GNAT family N-acetyltransferase n=1 Tax=Paenibacillus sp. BK720 TaxID=2587092 RepID=UPI0014247DED|nr:GNAT family N-acetyltransferase [Paenibacillus sp. BK720]NIK70340.1 putative GNAT family N-acyltransferase [Paenibacillus sp. BK720]